MEDKKIIELYHSRSENALVETEKKYGRLVTYLISRLIINRSDIEECTNDTYFGVWTTIPPKSPNNLKAYILKIARNQALKKYEYIHAAKRDPDLCLPYEELSSSISIDEAEDRNNNQLCEILEQFLDTLPKTHRQVFMLRYWYFMSVKEIMECCGMSKSKVETILFRTRNKLKDALKERSYL